MWLVQYDIRLDALSQIEIDQEKLDKLIRFWSTTPWPLQEGQEYSKTKFNRYPVKEK